MIDTDLRDVPARSRRSKVFRVLGYVTWAIMFVGCVAVLIGVIHVVRTNQRGQQAVTHYMHWLPQRDLPTSYEAWLHQQYGEDLDAVRRNGQLMQAALMLPQPEQAIRDQMVIVGSGDRPEHMEQISPELRGSLAQYVEQDRLFYELFDHARGRGRYSFSANTGADQMGALELMSQVRAAARRQTVRLLHAQARDDSVAATNALRAIIEAASLLRDEPYGVSQLVRLSCEAMMVEEMQDMLSRITLDDTQLEELIGELQSMQDDHAIARATGGNLSKVPRILMYPEAAIADGVQMRFMLMGAFNDLVGQFDIREGMPPSQLADWEGRAELALLALRPGRMQIEMIEAAKETHELNLQLLAAPDLHAIVQIAAAYQNRLHQESSGVENDNETIADLIAMIPFWQIREANRRLAITALHVERYRQKHGDWPANIAAVEQAFDFIWFTDPFDQQPLRYRATENGVMVYSVGRSGVDHGGFTQDDTRKPGAPSDADDQVFHLYDAELRNSLPAVESRRPAWDSDDG